MQLHGRPAVAYRAITLPQQTGVHGQLEKLRQTARTGFASLDEIAAAETKARNHIDAAYYHLVQMERGLSKVTLAPIDNPHRLAAATPRMPITVRPNHDRAMLAA